MSDPGRHAAALDRVLELVVLLNQDMTQSLARDGLTVSRAHVLWELVHRGPSTQRALADALDVSARTITGLIDGLVATGFVTREAHPTDRRAALVTFTPHGERTAEALRHGQEELARELFADMSQARFNGFVDGLDHVLTRIRELAAAQAPEPATQAQELATQAQEPATQTRAPGQ